MLNPLPDLGPAPFSRQAGPPLPPLPGQAAWPYLKSPSWYLPNACRTMVTKAMTGFTIQNCSVAWGGRSKGWWGV